MIENFYKKVRLVFIPYLLLLVPCLVVYSFLNCYFYLLTPSRLVPEYIMLIFAPMGFAIVAVLICLRTRLRLLTIETEKDVPENLNLLAAAAIAIPLILWQYLLVTASSGLTPLNAPSDITKVGYSKYYSVAQFADLRKYMYTRLATTTSYKGRLLTHHQYFAMPLIDKAVFKNSLSAQDTLDVFDQLFKGNNMPLAWLCMEYEFKVAEKSNTREIEDEFIEDSEKAFSEMDFATITYMDRLGNSNLLHEYRNTIIKGDRKNELIILDAKFTSFEERNDHMLLWTIMGTLMSMGALLLILGTANWDEVRLRKFEEKKRIS